MFEVFDRITFYPITEAELNNAQAKGTQRQLARIEGGVLDLTAHEAWADTNGQDIAMTVAQRARAIKAAPFLDELIRTPEHRNAVASRNGCYGLEEEDEGDDCERVKAGIPGRCWKLFVEEGDKVEAGSVLVSRRLKPVICQVSLLPFLFFCFRFVLFATELTYFVSV